MCRNSCKPCRNCWPSRKKPVCVGWRVMAMTPVTSRVISGAGNESRVGILLHLGYIVELDVSGDYIRHRVTLVLGAGDGGFAHLHAVAVDIQVLARLRQGSGRETDDNETGFGIDHGDLACRPQIGFDDGGDDG